MSGVERVPADHLVHFMIDAVGELDVRTARVNEQGSGSEQYPPAMMLGLLIYSYATGVFGSRRIEQTTYENVAVRLLCADTHPDHDTICSFRRFMLRGLEKVSLEWILVTLSYNLRRLHTLGAVLKAA